MARAPRLAKRGHIAQETESRTTSFIAETTLSVTTITGTSGNPLHIDASDFILAG